MRIKELREAKGLTQEQLANKLGARLDWVSQQEREPLAMFTEMQLREIASALDCTVGELFNAPQASQEPDPEEVPEWAIVYGKLADQLKPVPQEDGGGKEVLFKAGEQILVLRQDFLGRITVRSQNGKMFLFSAHPRGGCVAFTKGDWLNQLNEATS